jgi:hypothetical protein
MVRRRARLLAVARAVGVHAAKGRRWAGGRARGGWRGIASLLESFFVGLFSFFS